jgi:Ca-activated chloride channel family protein
MRSFSFSFSSARPGFAAASLLLILQSGVSPLRAQAPRHAGIHADVNLVNVIVSVQDATGQPVPGLPRAAFTVLDEGRVQDVAIFEAETQQPLDLALMIDTSLSATKELDFEKEAAIRFIRRVVRPTDALAVYSISEGVERFTPFTSNLGTLETGVKRMTSGAGTSLYDAIYLAANDIRHRPSGHRRAIVLVTDAGETTSSYKFEDARRAALAAETLLYTIIVRAMRSDLLRNLAGEHAIETITDSTGGAMFTADDLGQLGSLYSQIDRELRTQYLLAFYPQPPPPPRSIRHLEVRVASGSPGADATLRVRHRKLYLTAGAAE